MLRMNHVRHPEIAFDILKTLNMKLNFAKCSLGVSSGKFLGYVVTKRGIDARLERIKAIMELEIPETI